MEAVAAVCRHCFGEVCSVTWEAEAAGDRVVAGAEADSAVADLVAVAAVLEEVLAVVVISAVVDPEAVGNTDFTDRKRIKYYP